MHDARHAESVNPFNPVYQSTLGQLTHAFEGMGHTTREAGGLALHEIASMVTQQASFLSTLDGFYFVTWVAVCGGIFALLQRRID
jgi:hypothetical protein